MGSSTRSVEDSVFLHVTRVDFFTGPSRLTLECDGGSSGAFVFWRELNGLTEQVTVSGSVREKERERGERGREIEEGKDERLRKKERGEGERGRKERMNDCEKKIAKIANRVMVCTREIC